MPSYAELVFYMFSMSSAVDCRDSKLTPTAPDMYNLLSTLFTVNTFNVFKVGFNLQQNSHSVKLIKLILLLQERWRLALP